MGIKRSPLVWIMCMSAVLGGCGGSDGGAEAPPPPPTIGADGGTASEVSGAAVIVPPGALESDTTIRIAMDSTGAPALPASLTGVGNTYVVTPHGGSFAEPVEVRIPAPNVTLQPNQELKLAKAQPGGEWLVLGGTTLADGKLQANVTSFSYFRAVTVTYPNAITFVPPFQITGATLDCGTHPCSPALHDRVTARYTLTTNSGMLPSQCQGESVPLYVWTTGVNGQTVLRGIGLPVSGGSATATLDHVALTMGGSIPASVDFQPVLVCQIWSMSLDSAFNRRVSWPGRLANPGLALVRAPAQLDVVTGRTADLEVIFQGGGVQAALSIFTAATPENRAVIDWQRSDNDGASWRNVARSYQNEADPLPFSEGTEWQYWGVTHSFVATDADQGALIRAMACYTPPAPRSPPPCVASTATRVNVLQVSAYPAITTGPRSMLIRTGQTASLSVTATGLPAPTLQWQQRPANSNGAWTNVTSGVGAATSQYTTPVMPLQANGTQYRVVVTNSVGSVDSVPVTISVSDLDIAPTITTQPASLTVVAGNDAVFAVDARGTEALSYQWHLNGNDIVGANGAVLRLTNVRLPNAGAYSVTVRNVVGDVDSQVATLNVTPGAPDPVAPSILTQPAAVTVNAGNTATFAVGVDGTGPFTFQWRRNGVNIAGATSAVLTLASVATGSAGNYDVIVGNAASAGVTSNSATLTVNAGGGAVAPIIVTQPSTLVVAQGASGLLAVAATGSGPLAYQWSLNGAPIPGATSAVLRFDVVDNNSRGTYVVEVSNGLGSVTSNAVEVILLGAPNITQHPAAASAFENGTADFHVIAQGSGVHYQWLRNGVSIPGANSADYTTPMLTSADSGAVFSVIVFNSAGLVFSNNAVLTVQSQVMPSFTQQPADQAVQAPAQASFSVVAIGVPTPSLQWQLSVDGGVSFNDIPGASQTSYTTAPTSTTDSNRRYRVRASNSAGDTYSAAATLLVTAPPSSRNWGTSVLVSNEQGQASAPSLATGGDGSAMAVWEQFDGVNFRYDIWGARYVAGAGWQAPQVLDNQNDPASAPSVAMDASGNALVVWTQYDGALYNVWERRYSKAAGAWTAPTILESNVVDSSAKVVMDSSGRGLAVWKGNAPPGQDQQFGRIAYYLGGWQPASTFATGAFGIQSIDVATSPSGQAVIAWSEFTSFQPLVADVLAVSCSLSGSGCGPSTPLESDTSGGWDAEPRVAINASGTAMAVWYRYDLATSTSSLRANRMLAGSWNAAPVFIDALDYSLNSTHSVAIDAAGNAIAVWAQEVSAGPSARIAPFANRFDASTGWGTPQPLERQDRMDDIFPTQQPRVAFGPAGEALAVWESGSGIISSALFSGGSWGPMLDVGAGAAGVSRAPQIAFDSGGTGITVFVQNSGFSNVPSVLGNRFE